MKLSEEAEQLFADMVEDLEEFIDTLYGDDSFSELVSLSTDLLDALQERLHR